MKKKKLNKNWLHDHINDPYVKLAQKEGYRARAAFKLKEIDEAEKLIKPGQVIVDLGCTPGSWGQYVRRKFGRARKVGASTAPSSAWTCCPWSRSRTCILFWGTSARRAFCASWTPFSTAASADLVLSDMAPNLSGIPTADSARMEHLIDLAIEFTQFHMKPSGALVVKCFKDMGFSQIVEKFRTEFKVVKQVKPKASRDKSSEIFLVGKGLKNPSADQYRTG